jgi:hypothetical protein
MRNGLERGEEDRLLPDLKLLSAIRLMVLRITSKILGQVTTSQIRD